MKFKLFFKGRLISEHSEFQDAEANARFTFFEFTSRLWDEYDLPPGFMILCKSDARVAA